MNNNGISQCQILVFTLSNQEYGLEIDKVKEVVVTPKISKMPLSENYIAGVANVKGTILAIIDLEVRLGLRNEARAAAYTLVLDDEKAKVGLLVHEVPNSLLIPISNIEPAETTLYHLASEQKLIHSIVKIGNRIIFLIDVFCIISKDLNTQIIT